MQEKDTYRSNMSYFATNMRVLVDIGLDNESSWSTFAWCPAWYWSGGHAHITSKLDLKSTQIEK